MNRPNLTAGSLLEVGVWALQGRHREGFWGAFVRSELPRRPSATEKRLGVRPGWAMLGSVPSRTLQVHGRKPGAKEEGVSSGQG